MAKRICMVGIRGIGKTTLNRSILHKMPWIDYLIGSEILRELVGDDFNNFDHYSEERKQHFREEAIRFMENRQFQTKKDILVDGHTTLLNDSYNVEGVFTELDCKFFTDLIHLTAPAETILKRRTEDQSKKRVLNIDIIKKELEGERDESLRIAKKYGMGWYEIDEEQHQNLQEVLYKLLVEIHEE